MMTNLLEGPERWAARPTGSSRLITKPGVPLMPAFVPDLGVRCRPSPCACSYFQRGLELSLNASEAELAGVLVEVLTREGAFAALTFVRSLSGMAQNPALRSF